MPTGEDWLHIFFMIAVGQGLFMAFVLIRKSKSWVDPPRMLAYSLVVFSVVLLYWIGYWRGAFSGKLVALEFLLANLDMLVCPLLFLFAKSRLGARYTLKRADLWHFSSFGLYFLHSANMASEVLFGVSFYTFDDFVGNNTFLLTFQFGKILQFIVYPVWVFMLDYRQRRRWQTSLGIILSVNAISRLVYLLMIITGNFSLDMDYALSVLIVVAIYSASYIVNTNPNSFFSKPKYEKSSLDFAHEGLVVKEVQKHFKETNAHLQPEYSISKLSEELGIPRHHLSQSINHSLNKSFNEYLNDMRIDHSLGILSDPKKSDEKILSIALDSGFNNKVSFHKNFKRVTGLSPKEYREKHVNYSVE